LEHRNKRKYFLFIALFLIFFFAEGQAYQGDPLEPVADHSFGYRSMEPSHSIDTHNCGKGCGAILSHNAQYIMNPSLVLMQQAFTFSVLYHYLDSASISVSDSKTSKLGGGVLYARHRGMNLIKSNFAIPFHERVFFGINFSSYLGDYAPIQRKGGQSFSFDVGMSAIISSFLVAGFGATDVITVKGNSIPRKLNLQLEFKLSNYLFINNAWQYHLEPGKEKFPDKRTELKNFDFYSGAEFRYNWFRAGFGFNNLSYSRDFSWDTTLKTFSIAFYQPQAGGIYGNFMYNKEYMTFTINLIWEPPVGRER
jgi:hypothetical protein